MSKIKELVKDQEAYFKYYRDGEFWYKANGFEFPVPLAEVGTSTLKDCDKAIYFMRYIRKHMEFLDECKKLGS